MHKSWIDSVGYKAIDVDIKIETFEEIQRTSSCINAQYSKSLETLRLMKNSR